MVLEILIREHPQTKTQFNTIMSKISDRTL